MAASKVDHIKMLAEIAGQWKNFDPRMYETFLRALDAITFDVTVAVTDAPSTEILQAQGRAQQARLFLRIFTEAVEPNRATP